MTVDEQADILVFSAHPDDVECAAAGFMVNRYVAVSDFFQFI